ncbi:flagellar export chaperone FliS [Shewanella frigidimarina]|jgi:flagellar protein FliS|uniref:flagellar export chaperone FliS n=1 Tax=Shewanella TaxID=22 RepID=UPI000F5062CF|nr:MULTISPECIES: flagellar export chaperone FliS [Shewanella]MBB1440433.1 flagellar export chaperone FliS [Shewanella sp. SG41-4]RPA30849.1 flagella export chaperone FliS [Shewanella frigidimarina]|tara:strand:- start:202 stop:606 length:405 start_codon:yes stop_codon:yes gene_type:complete
MRSSLQSYRKVSLESEIAVASPHRIIQMMFEGALQRIAQAKYAIQQKNPAQKGENIGKAVSIIAGLSGSLNMDAGADVSANLDSLYEYMLRRLSEANVANDIEMLEEVSALLRTIKEGWDTIPQDMHELTSEAS